MSDTNVAFSTFFTFGSLAETISRMIWLLLCVYFVPVSLPEPEDSFA